MRITDVESFTIHLPVSLADKVRGVYGDVPITRVRTDEGITGYGFAATDPVFVERLIKPTFVGEDPFNVEALLSRGLLYWPAVEHALWDIMGKATGKCVRDLLGGGRSAIPVYLTCVYPGQMGQRSFTPERQAELAVAYAEQGFKAIKLQMWRDDPDEDVEVVRLIRQAGYGRDRLEVMIDRTGGMSGQAWSFETALRVARALEAADATWLEEPLQPYALDDLTRLAASVDLPITGGEGCRGVWPFRTFLERKCYDIVQPDPTFSGGLWTTRKVGALAEAFGVQCIVHGRHEFNMFPWLQVAAAIPTCRILEVVYVVPPITPWEQWAPLTQLLTTPEFLHLENGVVTVPTGPGLGVPLDEAAVEEYRTGARGR